MNEVDWCALCLARVMNQDSRLVRVEIHHGDDTADIPVGVDGVQAVQTILSGDNPQWPPESTFWKVTPDGATLMYITAHTSHRGTRVCATHLVEE